MPEIVELEINRGRAPPVTPARADLLPRRFVAVGLQDARTLHVVDRLDGRNSLTGSPRFEFRSMSAPGGSGERVTSSSPSIVKLPAAT
jgi:hypothetical protein